MEKENLFEIISVVVTDIYFNHLYLSAFEKCEPNNQVVFINEYRSNITKYTNGLIYSGDELKYTQVNEILTAIYDLYNEEIYGLQNVINYDEYIDIFINAFVPKKEAEYIMDDKKIGFMVVCIEYLIKEFTDYICGYDILVNIHENHNNIRCGRDLQDACKYILESYRSETLSKCNGVKKIDSNNNTAIITKAITEIRNLKKQLIEKDTLILKLQEYINNIEMEKTIKMTNKLDVNSFQNNEESNNKNILLEKKETKNNILELNSLEKDSLIDFNNINDNIELSEQFNKMLDTISSESDDDNNI